MMSLAMAASQSLNYLKQNDIVDNILHSTFYEIFQEIVIRSKTIFKHEIKTY